MRENCNIEIEFRLRHCYVHKRVKVFVFLNFHDNKNIDVKVEEEKLKEYLDSLLLENSGSFFTSSRRYIKSKRSHFKFIIRRDNSLSI